jgi:hypothetical protein
MIVVDELNGRVILLIGKGGIEMVFCRQDRPGYQDRPLTIEVGFLSGSASLTIRCQSDDEVEFLQMIE